LHAQSPESRAARCDQASKGAFTTIPGAEPWYEHIVHENTWYVHAKEDGVLSNKTALFAIRGRAKVGQPAKDLMAQGQQWLPWSFTDESTITGDSKTPLNQTFTTEPAPLHKFLFFLEGLGFVKVTLLFHSVERRTDTPGRFNITSQETAVFEVKPLEAAHFELPLRGLEFRTAITVSVARSGIQI